MITENEAKLNGSRIQVLRVAVGCFNCKYLEICQPEERLKQYIEITNNVTLEMALENTSCECDEFELCMVSKTYADIHKRKEFEADYDEYRNGWLDFDYMAEWEEEIVWEEDVIIV